MNAFRPAAAAVLALAIGSACSAPKTRRNVPPENLDPATEESSSEHAPNGVPPQKSAEPQAPAYLNTALSPEARTADLLARLTRAEKVRLISGNDFETRPVKRLGIPPLKMTDGPNGVRWGRTATAFPVGIAQAASWDPPLVEKMAAVIAQEAQEKGRAVLLGPCVNISRVPQNGRNFECYGEDPYLSARTAVGFIKGVQGAGGISMVKHFAANNQEHRRREIDVRVSKRALHEIYFPAFRAAIVEAGAYSIMMAYNQVNGSFSTASEHLIRDVLKTRWGFRGLAVSDWDAAQSTEGPLRAGLDLEMPDGRHTGEDKVLPLIEAGTISDSLIDEKVTRLLWVMFDSGAFDNPPQEDPASEGSGPAAKAIALEMARSSMVLLKNVAYALPLESASTEADGTERATRQRRKGGSVSSLLVVGQPAVYPRFGGGGSGQVRTVSAVQPLEALKQALGESVDVRYEAGFVSPADVEDMPASVFSHAAKPGESAEKKRRGLRLSYFNNHDFSGEPAAVKVVATPDMTWSDEPPEEGVQADYFATRLEGFVTPPRPGRYRFLARANNGIRVFLAGRKIIDLWDGDFLDRSAFEIDLEAKPYRFKVEHKENKGTAHLHVQWGFGSANLQAALKAARTADAVVVFAGYSAFEERESEDHELTLPPEQVEAILRLSRANKRVIVVLNAGSPVVMEKWFGGPEAIVAAWYPGQEGGTAIAEILTGKVNPSGKLPFTFLKAWKHAPAFETYPETEGHAPYREGVFVGYRHYDAKRLPVRFPFGHGLSYTAFAYSDFSIQKQGTVEGTKRGQSPDNQNTAPPPGPQREEKFDTKAPAGAADAPEPRPGSPDSESFLITVDVKNVGPRRGAEVVQLYAGEVSPSVPRPPRALKAFRKVVLEPGASTTVSFRINAEDLAYFDPSRSQWTTNPGSYRVAVGSSSRDLRARGTLELE